MYLEREKNFIICQMKTAFQRFAASGPRDIRQKSQFDLVTEVDVAVEQYLTDAISREFPEDRIHAEEMASHETISGRTWTIDPIDGTCNMARNIPLYGVQVSLFQEGQPALGAIYLPFWEQMLWAVRGEGCWCNEERIYANRSTSLNNAVISFGDDSVNPINHKKTAEYAPIVHEVYNEKHPSSYKWLERTVNAYGNESYITDLASAIRSVLG